MKKEICVLLLSMALLTACSNETKSETEQVLEKENPIETSLNNETSSKNEDSPYFFGFKIENDYEHLSNDDQKQVDYLKEVIANKPLSEAEFEMLERLELMSDEAREIVFFYYISKLQEIVDTGNIDNKPLTFNNNLDVSEEVYNLKESGRNIESEDFLDEDNISDETRKALEEVYFNSLRLVEKASYIFVGFDTKEILYKFDQFKTPQFSTYLEYIEKDQELTHINKEGIVDYELINERASIAIEASSLSNYYKDYYSNEASFYLSWMVGYFEYLTTSEPLDFKKAKEPFDKYQRSESTAYLEIKNYIDLLKENDYQLSNAALEEVTKVLTKFSDETSMGYIKEDLESISPIN